MTNHHVHDSIAEDNILGGVVAEKMFATKTFSVCFETILILKNDLFRSTLADLRELQGFF